MRCRSLTLLALCLAPAAAHGAPGDLDPTFGTGGRATGPEVRALQVSSLRVQDDGKLVITGAGSPGEGTGGQFLVARLTAGGQIDGDYGFSGLGLLPAGLNVQSGAALPTGDGGLFSLAVTVEEPSAGSFVFRQAVARFDPFGGGDSGFGTGGAAVTPGPGGGTDVAGPVDALYLPDGDIAAAASVYNPGVTAPRLAAVTFAPGSGALNGYAELPSPAGGTDFAEGIVRTPDGKLVVAGSTRLVATPAFIHLARLESPSLATDTSFGTSGHVQLDLGLDQPELGGFAIQPDGKLLLAGWQRNPDFGQDVWVARLEADGSPDASFGTAGVRRLPTYNDDRARVTDVVRTPDGKIIVFGEVDNQPAGDEDRWFATRLTGTGEIDESFATGGFAVIPMANPQAQATAGGLLADGRLLIVGQREQSTDTDVVTVVRLQGDPATTTGGGTATPTGGGTVPSDGGAAPPCVNCSGRPGATGAGPVLRIRGGRVRGRKAKLRVTCPDGTGRCRGRLVLFVRPGTAVPARAADTRRLGAARLRIRAGQTKRVKVRLARSVARSIRARTPLPALAIATARDAAGNVGTTRANVTLRR